MKNIYADVNVDEKRVAIVEEGKLIDLNIQREGDNNNVGNIYLGKVQNVVEAINSCFVDIGKGKNAFLPVADYKGDIRKGEMVLVQVNKEELHDKGAKITGKITFPGKNIILMPTESKVGVSKNISDPEERKRLREIMSGISRDKVGFVARTSARKRKKKEIIREGKYLLKCWNRVKREYSKAKKNNSPKLLYAESDAVLYVAREFLDKDTARFFINDKDTYKKVSGFVKLTFPELKDLVMYYDSDLPLFERYKIEAQIENLKRRTIQLDCGGYIIVEQTEALTAIDVNTGSFTGGSNREETAIKVNAEAARMAASQIILRDIGGIIIIDFIDLERKKNRDRLLSILKEEMRVDKAKLKIFPMSRLGLIEMTRQRRKESIMKILCRDCPYCQGSGMVFSETTMYIKIKRELLRMSARKEIKKVQLFVHPRVADVFDEKGFKNIEKAIKKKIVLRRDYKLHHEEFKLS